jgi:hypothetical protein
MAPKLIMYTQPNTTTAHIEIQWPSKYVREGHILLATLSLQKHVICSSWSSGVDWGWDCVVLGGFILSLIGFRVSYFSPARWWRYGGRRVPTIERSASLARQAWGKCSSEICHTSQVRTAGHWFCWMNMLYESVVGFGATKLRRFDMFD